jgi:O-antigen biosynthesis protein WbqP
VHSPFGEASDELLFAELDGQREAIIQMLLANADKARSMARKVTRRIHSDATASACACRSALQHALITAPDARDPEMMRRIDAVAGRVLPANLIWSKRHAHQVAYSYRPPLPQTRGDVPGYHDTDAIRMKRIFDILFGALVLIVFSVSMVLLAILIRLSSKGPSVYWSDRIGRNNTLFKMPKFRTMRQGTPAVATHLLHNPGNYVTPIGKVLRKLSLDELPQLYSVLKGDMSFVGPRPALFNQSDLRDLRTQKGVHRLVPGVTGWAQINGRDELPIPEKVQHDEYYLHHRSFGFDLHILALTIIRVARRSGVTH